MSDSNEAVVSRYRELDWKPFLPIAFLLLLYVLFMPTRYGFPFGALEAHQKIIALSAFPTFMGSFYWFVKVNYAE